MQRFYTMNITFIIPPSYDAFEPAERSAGCTRVVYIAPNIYELTVAAIVESNDNYNVRYHDSVYFKESVQQFKLFLDNDDSDVYIIWTVNLSIDTDLKVISDIFARHSSAKVILLGPGATFFTKKCLIDNRVFIVRGEPDATIIPLLDALRTNAPLDDIQGISYIADGKIINNKSRNLITDLDALPFPARHLVADHAYHNPKLKTSPYTTMFTSRNCPFHCIYCVPSSLTFAREIEFKKDNNRKPPISFRSVESVAKEIESIAAQGYKAIGFMDDNFIWNEQRTRGICDALKKHNMLWGCEARVDSITEPIAKLLGESGCRYIDLGVESFNDDILKYIKKGIKSDDIYRAIALLKKYKVPVKLNILIGSSPLETKETIRHTLHEAKRLKVDQVMFNIVSPFPGTEYYKICKENGWLDTPDYIPTDVQRNSILNLPHISAKEMERQLFKSNLSFFLSPDFVFKQIKRFHSVGEFVHALKALKTKLFG
jgi:radical SAM superfamily enzyme YgiQ (UPF0313 family)